MPSVLASPELTFLDANGNPIAGGTINTYVPGTTTAKATYTNSAGSVANANPIVLDAAGRCIAWGTGQYRMLVKDAGGNLIYDQVTGPSDSGTVNVLDYGATGDGSTDDTTAFQNAYNAAQTNGHVIVPATGHTYTISGTVTGTKAVTWDCYAVPTTGLTFTLPGVVITHVDPSGGTGGMNILQNTCSDFDFGSLRIDRNASFSGGRVGFTNAAARAISTVSAGVTSFEWCILGILNNSATAGQNVAVYGQGNRQVTGTGPTWAGCLEAHDHSGESNPSNGLIGLEVDVMANGGDSHNTRIGIDVVGGIGLGSTNAPTIYCGIRMGPMGGVSTNASWNYGLFFQNFAGVNAILIQGSPCTYGVYCTGTLNVGFDTSSATISVDAVRVALGQAIAFDANSIVRLYEASGPNLVCDGGRLIMKQSFGMPSSGNIATTATAGSATLPATPGGFIVITIDATNYKIPYYNA